MPHLHSVINDLAAIVAASKDCEPTASNAADVPLLLTHVELWLTPPGEGEAPHLRTCATEQKNFGHSETRQRTKKTTSQRKG